MGQIVDRAAVLVEIQEKSTLQLQDMDNAYTEVEMSGGIGEKPEEVCEVVNEYEVAELGELVRLLRASLEG